MQTRWFLTNPRYLAISVTLDGPDPENPNSLRVFCFDISLRPVLALHCASTWTAFGCCENFVFLITPFASFSFVSDHLDTFSDVPRSVQHASFSRLLSNLGESLVRTTFPSPSEIYPSLVTYLAVSGPLPYFYASVIFGIISLSVNAGLPLYFVRTFVYL